MANAERKEGKPENIWFWVILASSLVLGVILEFCPVSFVQHIGIALIIAAVLGGTVDLYLKKKLMRDAIGAALGYLLPPELRPELVWIYEQNLFWKEWEVSVDLKPEQDCMLVRVSLKRTLVNRGNRSIRNPHLTIAIDEWGFPKIKTEIRSFGIAYRGITYDLSGGAHVEQTPIQVYGKLDPNLEVVLDRNEEISWWATYEEPRRLSDSIHLTTRYPVINAKAHINSPDDYDVSMIFDSRMKHEVIKYGKVSGMVDGVMLPHQGFRVKWFRKVLSA